MLILLLVAAADLPQTSVNPNTSDAWLGRLYTVLMILGVLAGAWWKYKKNADAKLDARIEKHTASFREDLREHTVAEGDIVKAVVADALEPIAANVNKIVGSIDIIVKSQDASERRTDDRFEHVYDRIGQMSRQS